MRRHTPLSTTQRRLTTVSLLAMPSLAHSSSTRLLPCRQCTFSCVKPCLSATPSTLYCSCCGVRSRSLAPDDPFGEKSSWEDPSGGIYAAWKDVDQEGFVNASQSAEVRQAHFGPEWARFTTVGRLAVKKMKEEAAVTSTGSGGAASSSSTAATPAPRRYPTAEEMHEAELQEKRRLMERNYSSYAAFAEHELGAGEGFSSMEESEGNLEAASHSEGEGPMLSAASMEREFAALEGVGGRDRMAQRNAEREALDSLEAAEVEETVSLPNFVYETSTATSTYDDDVSHRTSPSLAAAAGFPDARALTAERRSLEDADHARLTDVPYGQKRAATVGGDTQAPSTLPVFIDPATVASAGGGAFPSSSDRTATATTTPSAIPAPVIEQVMATLGLPHGDAKFPLTDPVHWGTEDILHFMTVMEKRPAEVHAAAPRATWTTMEESMCSAFRMAGVTGDTLLNVVVPPRLFRLMRRWHLRRQDAVSRAWKQRHTTPSVATVGNDAVGEKGFALVPQRVADEVVAQTRAKLDEAVQPLDRILIQETILLCFPYGR